MEIALIVLLLLAGFFLFGKSKKEETELDKAVHPIDGIQHGTKSILFMVLCVMFVLGAMLLIGILSLPPQ